MKPRLVELKYDESEHEGWRAIAEILGRALGTPVCEKTAQRYADPSFPNPLPVGQRGNGVRFVRLDAELEAWVAWFKGKPRELRRAPTGDRRRSLSGRVQRGPGSTSAAQPSCR